MTFNYHTLSYNIRSHSGANHNEMMMWEDQSKELPNGELPVAGDARCSQSSQNKQWLQCCMKGTMYGFQNIRNWQPLHDINNIDNSRWGILYLIRALCLAHMFRKKIPCRLPRSDKHITHIVGIIDRKRGIIDQMCIITVQLDDFAETSKRVTFRISDDQTVSSDPMLEQIVWLCSRAPSRRYTAMPLNTTHKLMLLRSLSLLRSELEFSTPPNDVAE